VQPRALGHQLADDGKIIAPPASEPSAGSGETDTSRNAGTAATGCGALVMIA
jgi:hypothetical protein